MSPWWRNEGDDLLNKLRVAQKQMGGAITPRGLELEFDLVITDDFESFV
jgi:hypothetical protein